MLRCKSVKNCTGVGEKPVLITQKSFQSFKISKYLLTGHVWSCGVITVVSKDLNSSHTGMNLEMTKRKEVQLKSREGLS